MYPGDKNYTAAIGQEARKVNFGDYVVIYKIDDDHRRVDVTTFMHGASRRDA